LLQADDGTDRHNVAVDTSGRLQVDIAEQSDAADLKVTLDSEKVVLGASDGTDIGNVDVATHPADTFVAEEGALGKGVLLQADDGTDRHNVAVDTSGRLQVDIAEQSDAADLKITLDTESVVSSAADNFKADANVQVGDADASATNPLPTNAQSQSSYVYDGVTRCEVKRRNVVTSTSGADLIAKVEGKKFRILAMAITAVSATVTNAYLEDEDATAVFGSATGLLPLSLDADGDNMPGLVLPWNLGGWFQTATVNKDLHIKLSAAQVVVVTLTYIEVA